MELSEVITGLNLLCSLCLRNVSLSAGIGLEGSEGLGIGMMTSETMKREKFSKEEL